MRQPGPRDTRMTFAQLASLQQQQQQRGSLHVTESSGSSVQMQQLRESHQPLLQSHRTPPVAGVAAAAVAAAAAAAATPGRQQKQQMMQSKKSSSGGRGLLEPHSTDGGGSGGCEGHGRGSGAGGNSGSGSGRIGIKGRRQIMRRARKHPTVDRIITLLQDKRIDDDQLEQIQDLQLPLLRKILNVIFISLGVVFLLGVIVVIIYTNIGKDDHSKKN